MEPTITCAALEKQIVELARKHVETHDPEVREKVYRLADQLKMMVEKVKAQSH